MDPLNSDSSSSAVSSEENEAEEREGRHAHRPRDDVAVGAARPGEHAEGAGGHDEAARTRASASAGGGMIFCSFGRGGTSMRPSRGFP